VSGIITGLTKFFISLGIIEKIFVGLGITILLFAIIIWILSSFKKYQKAKRLKNKEWIRINMPYLAELRINLAKANERVSSIAFSIAKKDISFSTMVKCNKEYEQMVQNGMISKPFSVGVKIKDMKTYQKILKKSISRIGKNKRKLINGMESFSEIMEKNRIGLSPILAKDKDYQNILSKINEEKAVANSKIMTAVDIYLRASYGTNSSFMFYSYIQHALYKKDKRSKEAFPELFRPLTTVRQEIDHFMSKLLSDIEDVIEESIDYHAAEQE